MDGTTPKHPLDEKAKDHGVLYLGIDLGTSRTSVASSNGQRVTISSHVGYPKDVVSKKLLKKDVLFGDEAVEHRLSLKFYRPLAAGVLKHSNKTTDDVDGNMKAAADLIREIIRVSRRWADSRFRDIRWFGQPARGGHFAAFEQPALFVDEVRGFFRTVRA